MPIAPTVWLLGPMRTISRSQPAGMVMVWSTVTVWPPPTGTLSSC